MIENFIAFRNFPTLNQAKELELLLNKNNIKTVIGDNIPPLDVSFSGSTLRNQYEIKIDPSDFEKAEVILEKDTENLLDTIDKDYYLLDFTNEELYEILLNSDEWNVFDYKLAQKLLTDRGKTIDSEMLASLKKERLKTLAKPEENQKAWIIAGYVFALLGGGIGIVIGYSLWRSKKTLPNGERIYSYNAEDRKNGQRIFLISIIIFPIALIIKILSNTGVLNS
ncbi:hypothetical protein C8C83_2196 [Flavobacterium sp. 90]|uniref:hypothetical protein n=1 Tax=unclassified Flavobacterium TaxID=196869 RepID=UPI000EACE69D|nr:MULTISPECIES: hypothetical protein [unclassified Flavobacterium]RKR10519.1 hypothetical protein C8C82_2499 [Flavobacterium sp. 81]TCK54304.1 hypothetical protein C8C83_2196 [Flavobacterium sp. 90]